MRPRGVRVADFWIDKTEVSVRQFKRFLEATGHAPPGHWTLPGLKRRFESTEWDDRPAVFVTYEAARAYAEWAGKRLPTSHEWQRAARGAEAWLMPWSKTKTPIVNKARVSVVNLQDLKLEPGKAAMVEASYKYLWPVTAFGGEGGDKGPGGLLNALGNAREWTETMRSAIHPDGLVRPETFLRFTMGMGWSDGANATLKNYGVMLITEELSVQGFRCAKSVRS